MMRQWTRVTRAHPCPICRKPDWCGFTTDGEMCCCMRVESSRAARNGGWIHILRESKPDHTAAPPVRPRPKVTSVAGLAGLWRQATSDLQYADLSGALGVSVDALRSLGAGWSEPYKAWSFPMRSAQGMTVGVRLRAMDGRKWAVRGSNEGMFYPETTPADHTAWVVEGPTDAAAGLTLGFWTVGRPSCSGGVDDIQALFKRLAIHRAVIIADRDEPKARPSGGLWRPGSQGATRLGAALDVPYKIIFPAAKDLRAWLREGANAQQIITLADSFPWVKRR